jgi:tetratricopeptide (TPR) repeat protein
MVATQLRPSTTQPLRSSGGAGSRSDRAARSRYARIARDVAPWALTALIVLAPQALGGIYPDAMVAIALGAGVCMALALLSARSTELPGNLLLAVTLGPLVWTVLQVMPLPCWLVEALAPLSASRLREAHALLKLEAPSFCSITRDPAGTREEVVKGLAIACGMLSAAILAARGEQRVVFRAVAGSTVLMALVAITHQLVGATHVFGMYQPIEMREMPLLAPLLNPNNLGGFLAMGIPVLMGLALEEDNPRVRVALLGAVGLVAASALMTRSRGAAGAVALGPALYALLAAVRTRHASGRASAGPAWLRNATLAGVAIVLGLATWAWLDELVAEFESSGWDKLDLIARVARFATSAPWVGVGRGAFAPAFVNTMQEHYRFDYAESLLVQWVVDWGLPAALALSIALAALWARAALRARSHARVGAVAAVATVVAQNMVDLGLELLGPALVAACLLGACASFPRVNRPQGTGARALWIVGGSIAAASLITPLALASRLIEEHGPTVEQRLEALAGDKDSARFKALLQRAVLAHPSEPMLVIIGAHAALKRRDPSAGRFINRGMQLSPGWAAPHVQAAQWLWNSGLRHQALLELRAAAELEVHTIDGILCPMAMADPVGAIEVGAPRKNRARVGYLERLAGCLPRDSEHVLRVDDELLRIAKRPINSYIRRTQRLLRERRFDEAAKAAEGARAHEPANVTAAVLGAQAYSSAGRPAEAFKMLEAGVEGGANPVAIYSQMARLAAVAKDRAKMKDALGLLRGWVGTDAEALERAYRLEATLEQDLGNIGASLAAYEEAYRVANRPEALRGVAQAAERLGDQRRALRAYADLCAFGAEGGDACKHRDRLKTGGLKP